MELNNCKITSVSYYFKSLFSITDGKGDIIACVPSVEQAQLIIRALETSKKLLDVISAHELVSLSCDRDGNEYCECLQDAVAELKKILGS